MARGSVQKKRSIWLGLGLSVLGLLGIVSFGREARAVPSFARQTGLNCTACHTAFPQLTPFGRSFKLNGYTLAADDAAQLPPFAVMLQGGPGFTHVQKELPEEDVPRGFKENNNWSINQASLFYAGRVLGPYAEKVAGQTIGQVLNKVGVFSQLTWDGVANAWAWDNTEVRVANKMDVGDTPLVLGAYLNNNPTMQDLWNTTPVWGFPFSSSSLAPAPGASPLLAGGLGQQVVGLGAYTMIADMLYLDVGAYHNISRSTQNALGVDTAGQNKIEDYSPYWRVALEKSFGESSIELGTYGLVSRVLPGGATDVGNDRIYDQGVDLQYQYISHDHDFTLLANWLHENQQLHASQQLGDAERQNGKLWTASFTGSYLFEETYGLDVQFFDTQGSRDADLYGTRTGRPGSNGWIFQLNWLPLNRSGGPDFWPKSNVKLSLQYARYHSFDGSSQDYNGDGRSASDNNTLYAEAWIAF